LPLSHLLDTGGKYDLSTDTWAETSTTNAPSTQVAHTAVWTGSEMIVWGGDSSGGAANNGGRYSAQYGPTRGRLRHCGRARLHARGHSSTCNLQTPDLERRSRVRYKQSTADTAVQGPRHWGVVIYSSFDIWASSFFLRPRVIGAISAILRSNKVSKELLTRFRPPT